MPYHECFRHEFNANDVSLLNAKTYPRQEIVQAAVDKFESAMNDRFHDGITRTICKITFGRPHRSSRQPQVESIVLTAELNAQVTHAHRTVAAMLGILEGVFLSLKLILMHDDAMVNWPRRPSNHEREEYSYPH